MGRVVRVATAMAIALCAVAPARAFADHSPSFYIKWKASGGHAGANADVPSPHAGYAEGTQKCGVCHAVHRAPLAGTGWVDRSANAQYGTPANPDPTQPDGTAQYPAEAGGTNRATRQIYIVPDGTKTEMLLQSDVAGACDYCHITSSIGGEQIYAGNVKYRLDATSGAGGSNWESGFAHNNGCTDCHAVHGAFSVPGSTPAGNVVFKGAAASKVLKAYGKKTATTWQSEVVFAGTDADLTGLFADPDGVARDASLVATGNVPLFASKADAIKGTNCRLGVDVQDAQVTAFCTFCHQNYGYGSEMTINPQNVGITGATAAARKALSFDKKVVGKALFKGPWVYKSPTDAVLYNTQDESPAGLDGEVPYRTHPMKSADASFDATAVGANYHGRVAWAACDTCRDCHDAGQENYVGVMIQSFPHFTPGYFKFVKTAAYLGGPSAPINPVLAASISGVPAGDSAALAAIQSVLDSETVIKTTPTIQDGACLKCHVNETDDAGVGKTY